VERLAEQAGRLPRDVVSMAADWEASRPAARRIVIRQADGRM
jgi:hypothetical protein